MSFVKSFAELTSVVGRTYDFMNAEMLGIYWRTKPEIVKRLLPPPLEPVEEPLVFAFVADYPRTNFGPGYKEGALFLVAEFEGIVGNYCLSMPVTGDMAMAGGREIFGFPKKMANISLVKEGSQVSGSLERHGQRFFEVQADLAAPPNDPNFITLFGEKIKIEADSALAAISYNFKSFMAPEGSGFDYHPRLVRQKTLMRPYATQFGHVDVKMPPADCDPWYEVEVVQLLGATYTVGNNSMLAGEVVAEVDSMAFSPYAFLKWDI